MRSDHLPRKNERTTSRHAARTQRRRRLFVEGLEDRALLTTLFTPSVALQTRDGGGDRLGTVAWGMPLYTIYWGSFWARPDGQALQSQIQNSLNPMLYFSHYLDGIRQYGVPNHAGVPGSGTVEVNNISDPAEGFSQSNLVDVINNAIDNQGLPDSDTFSNEGLYLVFTPPGIRSDVVENGLPVGGYHSADTNFSFPFDFDTRHFAWIGDPTSAGLDRITTTISHEVAEAMTDPNDDGITVNSGGGNEIGDGDAEHFTHFVNGYKVQALWSQQDGTYAVYDGNSQSVTVTGANLVVTGDQLGPNFADNITVDLDAKGGVVVTENGETFSFTPGEIQTVSIFDGGGANTISVLKTSSSSPVSIIGGGNDTVNIGSNGSVQGIVGAVTITNPPNLTTINVDASADSSIHIATLDTRTGSDGLPFGQITSLAPAAINYKYADTGSLTLRTGAVINVNVLATGVSTSLVGNGPTTVNVGNRVSGVQEILGPLTITNPPDFTTLNVVDSADQTGRTATLDTFTDSSGNIFGRITGLAPASINYKQADIQSPTIVGGSGANIFIVVSLPSQAIALNTGAGDDTVILETASSGLVVDGQGGNNTLIGPDLAEGWSITGANAGGTGRVGFTNIQNLTGGSGADTFTFGDGTGVTGVINGGGGTNTLDYSFYRTGVTVNLPSRTATGTDVVLNIQNVTGSLANDSITGDFTSNVLSGNGGTDVLNGGSGGADTFILAATQGTATTVTGFGTADTLQGANIANIWTITGANAGNVDGIAFAGIAKLTGGTLTDAFRFTTGSVSGAVDGGGGTDTLDYSAGGAAVTVNLVTDTATGTGGFANIENLVGSTAADTLLGPNVAGTWSITGANAGTVGTFRFSAVENLKGGSADDAFQFAPAGSVSGRVSGGLGTNTLDYSLDGGLAVTVNLATSTASRTGGFAGILAVVGSTSARDTLVGPNVASTWSITDTNAGAVGTFHFSAVKNLIGGLNVDEFALSNGKGVIGTINGGAGSNWLDYALYTTPVTVNLATGTATGVSGGIGNIRDVRGGSGGNTLTGNALGNILIGGAGVDTITGGGGRSILIGDQGDDTVKGGSADDIVVGGFTDFDASSDAHDQALMAILTEWQSSDSYLTRISKIKAGVGVGSSKFVFGTTVHDDGNASPLTGGPGTDWFLKGTHDPITDLASGEQVN
jgi:hypothetical protein